MNTTLERGAEHIRGDFYRNFSGRKHDYFLLKEGEKKMLAGVTTVCSMLGGEKVNSLTKWAANMAVDHIKNEFDNIIFPDKESDGIEHVDCSYEELYRLLEEARTAYAKKKKDAGEHGTDRHAEVERYVLFCIQENDGKPDVDAARFADCGIDKFIEWSVNNVDHFLYAERPVHSADLHLAGTIDFGFVGKDGKRYVGDFKTSSGVYDIGYFAQVAAYKMLAEGEGDEKYDGTCIVRHGKDGSFEDFWRYDTASDEEAFMALLTLYRKSQTFVKPKR